MKINEMYEGDDLDFDMSVGGDSETDFEQEAMQVQLMKIEDEPDIEQQLRFEIAVIPEISEAASDAAAPDEADS